MALAPLKLHQRCRVRNLGLGEVLFVGQTAFAPGLWIGVRLDECLGKNDGSVQGKRYFEADANFGVFVRSSQIDLEQDGGHEALQTTPRHRKFESPQVPHTESHIGKLSTPIYRANAGGSSSVGRMRGEEIHARRAGYAKADSSPSVRTGRALANAQRVRDVKSGLLTQKQAIESRIENQAASRTPFDTPSKRSPLKKNPSTPSTLSSLSKESNSGPSNPSKSARVAATEVASSPVIRSSLDTQDSVAVSEKNRAAFTEFLEDPAASASTNELVTKLTQQLLEAQQSHSDTLQKADQESKAATELRNALEMQHEDQQQLQKTNTELQSLRETLESLKDSHESRLEELNEALEMATLDREMAEAKAENLEQELQVAKDTVEELRTEVEVRREYASQDNPLEPHSNALEQAQVEQQNVRLKEALVRMRDAAHESEGNLKKELSELRAEASIASDLRDKYNQLQAKYDHTNQIVEELKNQADLAQSTEEIIDQLSERNSALETRIDELLAEVRDLDLLRTVNDELEETHLEAESHLQRELAEKDELITKLRMQLTSQQSQVADHDSTIERFRTLVRDQAQELQQLRLRPTTTSIETESAPEAEQIVACSSSTSIKPSSKSVRDTQVAMLRQLEATQAQRHLDLVKHYLPPDFWTVDEPAIAVLLVLDRIAGLCKILQHAFDSSQDIEERYLAHTLDESLLHTCFLRHALAHLTVLAEQGSAALFTAPAELFVAQSKHLTMLTTSARSLQQLVDLQVNGGFNESDCLEVCKKLTPQFEQVSSGLQACESNLDLSAKETGSALLAAYDLDTVLTGAGLARVQLERISESHIDTTHAQEHLQTLVGVARRARVPAHNIIRLLASLRETKETVQIESVPELPALGQLSSALALNVAKLAWKLCEMAQNVLVEASALSSDLPLLETSERIQAIVQDAENLSHSLESLHMAIADPSNAIPIDDPSPLAARASAIYNATQHDQDLRAKLASLSTQNDELRRSLQQRTEALDAAGVKIDRLGFQLDKSRSAAANARELRTEVETLKQTLSQSSQQQWTSTPMHASTSLKSDDLSRALRTLRIENQYLRAHDYFVTLASLPPLHSATRPPSKQTQEWRSLAEKARSLTTSPEVVRLGKSSTRAIVQYQAQCRALCRVSDQVAQLI